MNDRFKKRLVICMVCALPLLILLNVWYSYRYFALGQAISAIEERQLELIERNKRLITGISILRSPGRIMNEARVLGMEMTGEERVEIITDDS